MKKHQIFTIAAITLWFTGQIAAATVPLSDVPYYNSVAINQTHTANYNLSEIKSKKNIVPVAVIGGGPGGLSSAFNAARERFHTVLFQGPKLGGQLMDTNYVENWPAITRDLGSDIVKRIEQQAEKAGAILVPESITDIDCSTWPFKLTTDKGTEVYALTVIIATGAKPRSLNVPGEKEYWGKGVASCTLCDAPFTQDNDVVIVGGGDSSVEFGISVAPFAKSITLLTKNEKLQISPRMKRRLEKYPDIKVIPNVKTNKINGDEKHVTEIEIEDLTTQKTETLPTRWVFLSIGQEPNTQMLRNQLAVNKEGCIILPTKSQQTEVPGIFAAGRVSDSPYKTGIVASGEGLKAALDAIKFLESLGFEEAMEEELEDRLYHYDKKPKAEYSVAEVESETAFENRLQASTKPLMLQFYSPTCPHCRAMEPTLAEVAHKMQDRVEVVRADVTKLSGLVKKYDIKSIPTFVLFKNKQETARIDGQMPQEKLTDFIKNSLN